MIFRYLINFKFVTLRLTSSKYFSETQLSLNLYKSIYITDMNLKLLFTFLLLLICSHGLISQTKNEKEERIHITEFPENAKKIIDQLPENCKRLKLYKETDGNIQSFEAKFKFQKRYYSLEFSKTGAIEDIEVLIKFKDINPTTKSQIESYYKDYYKKHKFMKIQKQFVYDDKSDPSKFVSEVLSKNHSAEINYEIIAEVKTKETREVREFTFNTNGSFINSRVVIPSSYEHVLY